MKLRPGSGGVLWMVAGAAILAVILSVVWHFYPGTDPTRAVALRASRIDLVDRMQIALASASEAEKSAVLAITDEDSLRFADQARAATAEIEEHGRELETLISTGAPREEDLLAQFSTAFAELKRIDADVLRLAVRNTNLKAYALLFGPAADTVAEMDGALARVTAKPAAPLDVRTQLLLASGARIGVLRIQTLLAPHIAEESDAKMDRLEAQMQGEETRVRADLDGLAALPALKDDADLKAAASAFVRYGELKARILVLSRENTNVRSLALSLNEKRKAMIICMDALNALKQAILAEPSASASHGRAVKAH